MMSESPVKGGSSDADRQSLPPDISGAFKQEAGHLYACFFSKAVLPGWVLVFSSALICLFWAGRTVKPDFHLYACTALSSYLLMLLAVAYVENPRGQAGSLHGSPRNWRRGRRKASLYRLGYKGIGFAVCFSAVVLGAQPLAAVLRQQYIPLTDLLPLSAGSIAMAFLCLIAILFDAYDKHPWDDYYRIGRLLSQRRVRELFWQCRTTLLFSVLRGFFFSYALSMLAVHYDQAFSGSMPIVFSAFGEWGNRLFFFTDFVKLILGMGAFLFVSRIMNDHPRSVDTQPLSWLATLACYPPLTMWILGWRSVAPQESTVAAFQSGGLYLVYAAVLGMLYLLYSIDILAWGSRFSQLSYRGLVKGGPFGYFKHPAYLSKCLILVLTVIPEMTRQTWMNSIVFLILVIGLYGLRAWFEERHLCRFQEYRQHYGKRRSRERKHD